MITLPELTRVPFSAFEPVRDFPSFRGQRNRPNSYCWTSPRKFVRCESLLERSILREAEFNGDVVDAVGQPLVVLDSLPGPGHTPDFLFLRASGVLELVDVCLRRDAEDEHRVRWSARTRTLCEAVGWQYSVRHELDEIVAANLDWLSGYVHEPVALPVYEEALYTAFDEPLSLSVGERLVGERAIVRPVLMHLLWLRRLSTDMGALLGNESLVWVTR